MKYLMPLIALLVSSCATEITNKGRSIQIATDSQKENYCKTVDIISASNGMGWGPTEDQQNAMNDIRNKAAAMGGNAIRVISSNYIATEGSSGAIIQAEVLDCKFP